MDNYSEDEFDSEDIVDEADASESPRGLRRAANKSKKLEQELLAAKRELAFAKAGIDPDDSRMKYFVRGYDGELTGAAVRQAALEAGFLASQQQEDPQVQAASAAQDRVMTAAAGAVIEDASEAAALSRMEQAMEEGGVEAMMSVARQYGIPIGSEM